VSGITVVLFGFLTRRTYFLVRYIRVEPWSQQVRHPHGQGFWRKV